MLIRKHSVAAFLFLSSAVAVQTGGQQSPLSVESVLDVRVFGEGSPLNFSPDGQWVAYAVRNNLRKDSDQSQNPEQTWECSGISWPAVESDVIVTNVQTGETKSVGQGRGDNWLPRWSPDGDYLAFLSDRDGGGYARLWTWELRTGKLRKLSGAVILANQIEWTPDGREILTTVRYGGGGTEGREHCKDLETAASHKSEGASDSEGILVYESGDGEKERPESTSPPWNLDLDVRDLALFDVGTSENRVLTEGVRVKRFELTPDGSRVAFSTEKNFEKAGSQQILFDLRVVSTETGRTETVAADIRMDVGGRSFAWLPDSLRLIFRTGGVLDQAGDCFMVNTDGKTMRNLTSFPPGKGYSGGFPPVWDEQRQQIYLIRDSALWKVSGTGEGASVLARIPGHGILQLVPQKRQLFSGGTKSTVVLANDPATKQDVFYKIDLETGQSRLLLAKGERYRERFLEELMEISPDGENMVYPAEGADHPVDLWVSDTAFHHPHRLTHINSQLDSVSTGEARLIHWRSLDGEELSGALLLPTGYQEGKRCPLLVFVYGGALESDQLNQFGFNGLGEPYNMQLFATRGYAVLLPDAPQHLGTPMLDLAKTVLPGVDKVVDMGIADPERMGIMGHSYGGYSVLGLMVQTKRFKAAMMGDGSGDLISSYGQLNADGSSYATSREQGQELMGGTPWEYRDRYIENSPVFYLNRVETPLLIVQGSADTTVHAYLSDEVFVGLRRLGKRVTYVKYVGEDHYPYAWKRENQIDFCNRLINWFDGWIGNGAGPH